MRELAVIHYDPDVDKYYVGYTQEAHSLDALEAFKMATVAVEEFAELQRDAKEKVRAGIEI
jgi:hypothetical protein